MSTDYRAAKDIPDATMVAAVRSAAILRGFGTATRWDVAMVLGGLEHLVGRETVSDIPGVPENVVLAKLAKLVKRGILSGCACGCRGDYAENENGDVE